MIKSTNDSKALSSVASFHPEYINLDERSIEELMRSFLEYAKQIPFTDDSGNVQGQWDEMYTNEILFLWVDISLLDIEGIDHRKQEIFDHWDHEGENDSLKLVEEVLRTLKHLYTHGSKLKLDWVITEIKSVIKDSLFKNVYSLYDYFEDNSRENDLTEITKWKEWLFNIWDIQPSTDSRAIEEIDVKLIFKIFIEDAINGLYIIQNKAKIIAENEIFVTGKHPAHIGLLFGFLKSYKSIQDQFNKIPKRHINYYYKTILKQKLLDPSPDFVNVFVKLMPSIDSAIIKEGELFSAGQDASGNDIIFESENDIELTQANIAEIKTLLFNKSKVIIPLEESNMVTGIYMDTIPLDSIEKELHDNKSWALFGSEQPYQKNKELPELGWAIASSVFYLSAGNRNVKLTYNLSDFENFKKIMETLENWNEEVNKKRISYENISLSEVEIFHLFLKNAFDIQITASDGWRTIENYMVQFEDIFSDEDRPSNYGSFLVEFTLPPNFPAWIPYQKTIHGEKYDTELPLISFKLKQETVYYPYTLLQEFKLISLDINVDVTHFKNLVAYNKHGLMDISQAVPILGINPLQDNLFHLGALEWQMKNLTCLKCRIKWIDLPKPNFEKYYEDYMSCKLNDNSFLIELSDHSSIKKSDTLFNTNNCVLEDESSFEFDGMNKSASNEAVYENELFNPKDSPLGFVGFKLIAPAVGFGSAIYANEMALYGQSILKNKKSKKMGLPPQKPFVPYANSIEVDYRSTHRIAFESKSSSGQSEAFDFFHIHPHGILKEASHKKIHNNHLLPDEYGDKGFLYIGLENVKPFTEVSIFLKIEPSVEPRKSKDIITIKYLSGNSWEDFGENVIENSTMEGQETGILRLFFPLDLESDHPFFDKSKNWIQLSIDSDDIRFIGKCKYINTNVGKLKRKIENEDGAFKVLDPLSITSLIGKNENIQSIFQPFHSFGGKNKEEENKFYARVSNRLGHKNRMVRPRDYQRMVMEKFSEVNWMEVLTPSRYDKGPVCVKPGNIEMIVMPKIEITGDRSSFYIKKKVQKEIEDYVKKHCSPSINVTVKSPEYEEIEVRCMLIKNNEQDYIPYHEISDIIKKQIAPWLFYEKSSFKKVNTSFSTGNLVYALSKHPNVKEVSWCQIIHISKDNNHPNKNKAAHYKFKDTFTDGDIIKPTNGRAILIPAREFKIYQTNDEIYEKLSVGNMDIGQTFILSKENDNDQSDQIQLVKIEEEKEEIKSYAFNLKKIIKE